MILINNIKATATDKDSNNYGFSYKLEKGLNIISGENSSGKSTVLSCIYYCLGMEQLLGSINEEALADCLKNEFKYSGKLIKVFESFAEIEIQNNKGEKATIKRVIKSPYNEKTNNIEVSVNENTFEKKFIHSHGDSDQPEGFYKWLSDFASIAIPVFTNEDDKTRKILYLQHIFSSAFVEQTKGWSDFFAQLPYFTTKKPKQKIIEYILGLKALVEEFHADVIKEKEATEKKKWVENVESFKIIASHYNFDSPSLNDEFDSSLSPTKIDKLALLTKNQNDETISVDELISLTQMKVQSLERDNIVKTNDQADNKIIEKQIIFKEKVGKLNSQLNTIKNEKLNEAVKQENYIKILEQLNKEINTLESLKKIGDLAELDLKDIDHCPVCNSSLLLEDSSNLKNLDKIDSAKSISFYKSERELYKSYLDSSKKLTDKYQKIILYYTDQISDNQKLLNEINKELVNDSRIPSRTNITEEIALKFEVEKLLKIKTSFNVLKDDLKVLAKDIAVLKEEKKSLQKNKEADEIIIGNLKSKFTELLKGFDYPQELINRIQIKNEEPSRLMPVVSNYGEGIPQPIRLKSSASDFIRALWAFYLALLIKAKNHVGVLILDEPGQHAMKLHSMKALIKVTTGIKDKQIILAISKDKSKDQEYALKDILVDVVEGKDYFINVINDNGKDDKLIQPIK